MGLGKDGVPPNQLQNAAPNLTKLQNLKVIKLQTHNLDMLQTPTLASDRPTIWPSYLSTT